MTITYTQIDLDTIQTSETHIDGSFTSGIVRKNETRTRTVQDGTEQVLVGHTEPTYDEEGNELTPSTPIYETQPKYIEQPYSPWDELVAADLAGDISVNWLDEVAYQAEQDAMAAQQTFKSTRQQLINTAVVDANGFLFDADEVSIGRMANAILALMNHPDTYALQWSLADTPTGVMTTVNLHDLKLAHQLAVSNMSTVWGV